MPSHFVNVQPQKWPEDWKMEIIIGQDFYWSAEWRDDDEQLLYLDGYNFRVQLKRGENVFLDYTTSAIGAGVAISEISITPDLLTSLTAGICDCLIWSIDPVGFKRILFDDVAVIHDA